MANVIIRKIQMSITFQPLSAQRLIGNFTLRVPAESSDIVVQTDDKTDEVPLGRGDVVTLERVNLQDISIKGAPTDVLYVIGATAK